MPATYLVVTMLEQEGVIHMMFCHTVYDDKTQTEARKLTLYVLLPVTATVTMAPLSWNYFSTFVYKLKLKIS